MAILRVMMIETRNRTENRAEKNEKIREKVLSYLNKTEGTVFIYASFGSEVETLGVIETLLEAGRAVAVPKVFAGKNIAFFRIGSLDELSPGYFGIPEPDAEEGDAEAVPAPGDVMIVPGVAFDEDGNRYGYGAGMYDRYLQVHPVRKVALAFEDQLTEGLEIDDEDVPMDVLITEEKVREWPERWS